MVSTQSAESYRRDHYRGAETTLECFQFSTLKCGDNIITLESNQHSNMFNSVRRIVLMIYFTGESNQHSNVFNSVRRIVMTRSLPGNQTNIRFCFKSVRRTALTISLPGNQTNIRMFSTRYAEL